MSQTRTKAALFTAGSFAVIFFFVDHVSSSEAKPDIKNGASEKTLFVAVAFPV